ncbi:uncharacterized protein LOC130997061 [Salvia miltiorrhiza]|uniref:uncharacterized protein LOC130997061 n=1 Tax=Salvia miltiorrhiza TaxID=226208 RepID=UPI0025AC2FFB|nr:uncharacterized protein LOC130997061 [Salvia miltiorrhiza]
MNNSDNGKRLLVKRKHEQSGMYYLTPLSPLDLSEISEESFDLPFLVPNQHPLHSHSNTCGGLLCFIDRITGNSYLCNPTTKQFQIFPPKEVSPSPNYWIHFDGGCLGYDSKSDDYKILRIWRHHGLGYTNRIFELYSLRSGSWKEIPSPESMLNSCTNRIIYVRGKCYWFSSSDWFSSSGSGVVSFDYSEESFSYLPLPRMAHRDGFSLVKFEDEDLLGIVYCGRRGVSYKAPQISSLPLGSEPGYYFEAWVWREGWDAVFNVSLGGVVGAETIYRPFLFLHGMDQLGVYDWAKKECKELGIYNAIEVFCYVESSVALPRGKPINGSPVLPTYEGEWQGMFGEDPREYDSSHEAYDADLDDFAANGFRVLDDIELEEEEQERRYDAVLDLKMEPEEEEDEKEVTDITYYSADHASDCVCCSELNNYYRAAKYFVIKSDSEDDVRKSIRHNAWSCTPYANKKLNAAYEDAQRVADGCPIFLFFFVDGSGQLCGMAEMTGPVDFHRDVDFDFRLRDKRSGSFPVKWHFIKDLANLKNFRFTILHNNENMPGTDKRDIQRLSYKKGLRMHNIFKRRTSTTSLLDFMQEEGEGRLQKQ